MRYLSHTIGIITPKLCSLALIATVPLSAELYLQTNETPFVPKVQREAPELSRRPLSVQLEALVLVPNASILETLDTACLCGLAIHDLNVPGGYKCLKEHLEPIFMGKTFSQDLLDEIKKEIILYYRHHDHPVVTVSVPEQDVTDGVLSLVVIEGCLGEVIPDGNCWFFDWQYKNNIRLRPGRAITNDTLLTDVAWMNRNPFRDVDVFFVPGKEEGTTDIELRIQDRFPVQVYGGGDNTGNTATGNARWFAGATWGNAFFLDQILSYQYTTNTDPKLFQSHTFHYTAPLPWHNLFIAYGGYAVMEPEIVGFERKKAHNFATSLRYVFPIGCIYGGHLQEARIGFDYKNYDNNLLFIGDDVQVALITKTINLTQFMASYTYGFENPCWKIGFDLEGFVSPGKLLDHETRARYDELSPGAKVAYIYGKMTLGTTYFTENRYSIATLIRAQASSNTLLPSEQFGLGGYDTVRGYDERVFNADNALCLNVELRTRPFSILQFFKKCTPCDELLFLFFWDYGLGIPHSRTWNQVSGTINGQPVMGLANSEENLPATEWLMGIGPGVRYKIGRYVSLRADWGVKLHKIEDDSSSRSKFHLGFLVSF